MRQKMQEIEKLFNRARAGKGSKNAGKKGAGTSRSDQYKRKGPPLDGRMRKDKRGMDKVAKRMKGKGKKAASAGVKKPIPAGKNRRR